jgi:outer membrane receptor protein involved in Fe transport
VKATFYLRAVLALACLTTAIGLPSLTLAQMVEEIVVTARKRAENIQEVPLAISAFTADQIERLNIEDVADVAKFESSVIFDQGFAPQDTRIVIRGLSPTRGRPNVATLVDGIDISSEAIGVAGGSLLINPRLFDVERIEVVKGPQSALYGRNAFAGAVSYVTKDTADELEASASIEMGDYGKSEVSFSVSGPLIQDTLGFRLNGVSWNEDGFYNNSITEGSVGGGEGQGAALTLQFTPNEVFKAKFRTEYSDDELDLGAQALLPFNTMAAVPAEASSCNGGPIRDASCPGPAQFFETFTGNTGVFDDMTVPAFTGRAPSADQVRVTYSPDFSRSLDGGLTAPDFSGTDREVFRTSLVMDWDVGAGTISSLTGYTDSNVYSNIDLDKFALAGDVLGSDVSTRGQVLNTNTDTTLFSQELRFTSDLDGPFQFIIGAQVWNEDAEQAERNNTLVADGTQCQLFNPPGPAPPGELFPSSCGFLGAVPGFSPFSSAPISPFYDDVFAARPTTNTNRFTDHTSAYLHVEWDISERFRIEAELRRTDEDSSVEGPDPIEVFPPFVDPPTGSPGSVILCGSNGICSFGPFIGAGVPAGVRGFAPVSSTAPFFVGPPLNTLVTPPGFQVLRFDRNDTFTAPRFTVEWDVAEGKLFYASYAEGIKPGGFSTITVGAFGIDANGDGLPLEIEFDREEIKVYELGGKGQWRDDTVRLNGALFYQDFTNKQISTQTVINGVLGNVIRNAAGAEITGLELEFLWRLTEDLTWTAGYTYLDSEYTDYAVATTGAGELARVGNCTLSPVDPDNPAAGNVCLADRTGNQLERVPEHSLVTTLAYRRAIRNDLSWFAEGTFLYQDERFIEDDNSWSLDSYVNLDLRFGLSADKWEVLVYVDNALDDDTIRSGGTGPGIAFGDFRTGALISPAPFPGELGTTVIAAPALPSSFYVNMPDKRLVGLRASYRF